MKNARVTFLSLVAFACGLFAASEGHAKPKGPDPNTPVVDDYKITSLSDSIPGRYTIGEWGFSALVEVTRGGITKRFLFDTSEKPDTVLYNVSKLGPQLPAGFNICSVQDVVISHNHSDHVGGLVMLRQTCAADPNHSNGLSIAHVGAQEVFWSRYAHTDVGGTVEKNTFVAQAPSFVANGGSFDINDQPHEFLLPGVFLTGLFSARTTKEPTSAQPVWTS